MGGFRRASPALEAGSAVGVVFFVAYHIAIIGKLQRSAAQVVAILVAQGLYFSTAYVVYGRGIYYRHSAGIVGYVQGFPFYLYIAATIGTGIYFPAAYVFAGVVFAAVAIVSMTSPLIYLLLNNLIPDVWGWFPVV